MLWMMLNSPHQKSVVAFSRWRAVGLQSRYHWQCIGIFSPWICKVLIVLMALASWSWRVLTWWVWDAVTNITQIFFLVKLCSIHQHRFFGTRSWFPAFWVQVATSTDFSPQSVFWSHVSGGLNNQVFVYWLEPQVDFWKISLGRDKRRAIF